MGVTIAVMRSAVPVSTGTQDFTTSDCGGLTPKAALLFLTRATSDGVAADHASFNMGAVVDSTHRWACGVNLQDAQATTNTDKYTESDHCIAMLTADGASIDGSADFSAWLTNGIRLNFDNAFPSGFLLTIVFFCGTDVSAYAGTADLGNTLNAETNITAVGFQPELVFSALLSPATLDTIAATANLSFGVAKESGGTVTQRTLAWRSTNAAAAVNQQLILSNLYAAAQIDGTPAFTPGVELGNFDSQGFSAFSRIAAAANVDLGYLALRFNGVVSTYVGNLATPTATGSSSVTAPGFQPQFAMLGLSMAEAINTGYTNDNANSFGIGIMTPTAQFCNSAWDDDAAADSNSACISDNQPINIQNGTNGTGLVASFTQFDATGWTVNYSDVETNAKQYWALAIQIGTTTHNVSANLQGTSNLTSAGKNTLAPTANEAGTSALTSAGKNTFALSANLVGTSSLTSAGKNTFAPTSNQVGTSSLTAAGKNTFAGISDQAGSSSLTVAARNVFALAGDLQATSALTSAGFNTFGGASAQAGTSSLTAELTINTNTWNVTASLGGTSALTSAGKNNFAPTSNLDATSALTSAGYNNFAGSTSLAGESALTAAGRIHYAAVAGLAGSSDLTSIGRNVFGLASDLAGTSQLTAAGKNTFASSTSLAGEGALTGAGFNEFGPISNLVGTSTLTADLTMAGSHSLSANLAGTSQLTSSGRNTHSIASALVGESALTASGFNRFDVAVSMAGIGALLSAGQNRFDLSIDLAGESQMIALGRNIHAPISTMDGASEATFALRNQFSPVANLPGTSSLAALGYNQFSLVSELFGESAMFVDTGEDGTRMLNPSMSTMDGSMRNL